MNSIRIKKILIISIIFLFSIKTNSMHMAITVDPELELPANITDAKADYWSFLPAEIKKEIILLLNEKDLLKISKILQNLSLTNKEFNKIINNTIFIGRFIQKLQITGNKFDLTGLSDLLDFVDLLKMPAAYEWFYRFINLNAKEIGSQNLNALFHEAIKRKNKRIIQIMVNNSLVDVNSFDAEGYPAIIRALPILSKLEQKKRSFEIAQLLLSHPEININASMSKNFNPGLYSDLGPRMGLLNIAIRSIDINLMKFLLNLPNIDVNNLMNIFSTPLYMAEHEYSFLIEKAESEVPSQLIELEEDKQNLEEIIQLLKSKGARAKSIFDDLQNNPQ